MRRHWGTAHCVCSKCEAQFDCKDELAAHRCAIKRRLCEWPVELDADFPDVFALDWSSLPPSDLGTSV